MQKSARPWHIRTVIRRQRLIQRRCNQCSNGVARLDPYDPSTFRHAGQCEHRSTSDPALLRAILKVRDGAGGGYWWVECASCEIGWQVPHHAESVG